MTPKWYQIAIAELGRGSGEQSVARNSGAFPGGAGSGLSRAHDSGNEHRGGDRSRDQR